MYSKETKILVVDDMGTMRRIIKNSLKDLGYANVVEAKEGESAWEAIKNSIEAKAPIEIILSDWNMPKLNGLELLKKVRDDAVTSKIPFIMLTAKSDSNDTAEAESFGVSAYMTKPFSTVELESTFKLIFEKMAA